jgi:hypothetical protein
MGDVVLSAHHLQQYGPEQSDSNEQAHCHGGEEVYHLRQPTACRFTPSAVSACGTQRA